MDEYPKRVYIYGQSQNKEDFLEVVLKQAQAFYLASKKLYLHSDIKRVSERIHISFDKDRDTSIGYELDRGSELIPAFMCASFSCELFLKARLYAKLSEPQIFNNRKKYQGHSLKDLFKHLDPIKK